MPVLTTTQKLDTPLRRYGAFLYCSHGSQQQFQYLSFLGVAQPDSKAASVLLKNLLGLAVGVSLGQQMKHRARLLWCLDRNLPVSTFIVSFAQELIYSMAVYRSMQCDCVSLGHVAPHGYFQGPFSLERSDQYSWNYQFPKGEMGHPLSVVIQKERCKNILQSQSFACCRNQHSCPVNRTQTVVTGSSGE